MYNYIHWEGAADFGGSYIVRSTSLERSTLFSNTNFDLIKQPESIPPNSYPLSDKPSTIQPTNLNTHIEMDKLISHVKAEAANADEAGRKKLIDVLRDLSIELETPWDSMQRIMYLV